MAQAEQSYPSDVVLAVQCECGFEVRGTADEVVEGIGRHARENHNMTATREQVLARARPA